MSAKRDLIVIGAGPAGATAAVAAARAGLSVALVEECEQAGGQVYRAPARGLVQSKYDPDIAAGVALRAGVADARIDRYFERRVWSVSRGFRVDVAGPAGHEVLSAPRLIAATGAHERVVPFPGWTLPGVIGLAAATILLKSQAMWPGRRVVIAGRGPLLAVVASKVVAAGGEIGAIVDRASAGDWLSAARGMAARPRLLARGLGWLLAIGRARVPVLFRHAVMAAEGEAQVRRVHVGAVGREGTPISGRLREFDVDTLVVGNGLVPGGEIPRLLHADLTFDRRRGGWIPSRDAFMRTSVAGLYAIGDGAGIRGAEPARLEGEVAGLTAAMDNGNISPDEHRRQTGPLLRLLGSYAPFADAMAAMMALREADVAAIAPDTVVCRCEDVTRGDIDKAAGSGARDVSQMKHFTRCGMGPCQGRMCGDVAAELLARALGVPRETVGFWTGRPPLRPVQLGSLVGAFDYGDIPIPKPAPL